MRSWSNRVLSVRRVTQDNQGKKTAGVDGVKSLSPEARLKLAGQLKLTDKSKPTRRVWIPKPGRDEKRPLGIPTITDRALQALVKLALEPEWEAFFEPNSFGFRPGRSAHDAIEAIFKAISKKPKYVLDADIAKCFDKINQDKLLIKLKTFPTIKRQIKAWLKSGVIDSKNMFPTTEGVPQGGVISPLLANIALHGMETILKEFATTLDVKDNRGRQISDRDKVRRLSVIRAADDFIILHESLAVIEQCKELIATWLKDMGLEFKPSQTRISHTLNQHNENIGFEFLGFHIRQYKTGMYRSAKNSKGEPLGFNTLIIPSQEKRQNHQKRIGEIIDRQKNSHQSKLIRELNPVIRGWANYYSTITCKEVFSRMDNLVHQKLRAWANRRCTRSNKHLVSSNYWHTVGNEHWRFCTTEGLKLTRHSDIEKKEYVKVKEGRSPYDGDWVYWSSRMGNHPEVSTKMATLMKRQKGKCNHGGLNFKYGDVIEIDQINPKSKGGNNKYDNLQALHRHCHDEKTACDGSLGIHDNEPSL